MNYTWVTLADSEEYLKNVYALAFSLKQSNTQYPLQVMIPENSINKQSINTFNKLCETLNYSINIIYIPNLMFNILAPFPNIFNSTLNKFFIFCLEKYEKICFLDADIFIFSNCDDIFNKNFPVIDTRNNGEISSGIFAVYPNKIFWYFILNICFTHRFQNDEEVISFLHNEGLFPLNTLIENDKRFFHDGGYPKCWSKFSWQELTNYLQLNYNNIYQILASSEKIPSIYSNEKEKLYIQQIKTNLKKQYN